MFEDYHFGEDYGPASMVQEDLARIRLGLTLEFDLTQAKSAAILDIFFDLKLSLLQSKSSSYVSLRKLIINYNKDTFQSFSAHLIQSDLVEDYLIEDVLNFIQIMDLDLGLSETIATNILIYLAISIGE
ncbi:MAG: hypothetical protein P8P48_12895 [Saprospiraceae bacterium]|nr:hypothetical protein [Saprospiraceae bacterium]